MLKTVSSITNAIGALNYKGTWNATTNTPTITSSVGVKGDYYQVSVAGSTAINGISNWGVGDVIAFNGVVWQRIEGGADLNGVNLSVSGTTTLSGLTASTALALDASKDVVSVTNTGTDNNVLSTSPSITTPRVITSINDTNGNELFGVTATASAVNELTIANAATGNNPVISATGTDTNIGITLTPKGTGNAVLTSGNLVVANGNGIDFSATSGTGTSELLDDYEEGTWTPTLVGSTTPGNHTYGGNTYGTYTKIGRLVTLNFVITLASTGTIAGSIDVSNLPFSLSAANFANRYPIGACGWGALTTNWVNVLIGSNGATTTLRLTGAKVAGTGSIDMDAADLSNTSVFVGSIQYVN
jgi:hypothetical protein